MSELHDFLARHPWSTWELISTLFSPSVVIAELLGQAELYWTVDISGLGRCYALSGEPNETLVSAERWNQARWLMLPLCRAYQKTRGVNIFLTSISPGIDADGEFSIEDGSRSFFYRVWVDLGGCEPPAIGFVRHPPKFFDSPKYQDDIIWTTDLKRAQAIELQLKLNWRASKVIKIVVNDSPNLVKVSLRGGKRFQKVQLTEGSVQKLIQERMRGEDPSSSVFSNSLGSLSAELDGENWTILNRLGCVPYLTEEELSTVLAGRIHNSILKKLQHLHKLGLIGDIKHTGKDSPLFLTSKALELLRRRWNTGVEDLYRFQNWPMGISEQGLLTYSTHAIDVRDVHDRLVKEFCLALIRQAGERSNDQQGLSFDLTATKGARVIFPFYKRKDSDIVMDLALLSPDAILTATYWNQSLLDKKGVNGSARKGTREIFLELDRSTISRVDIEARMRKYQLLFHNLHSKEKPLLLWVIDGDEKRENLILTLLREFQIPGCSTRLERLFVTKMPHATEDITTSICRLNPLQPVYQLPGSKEPKALLEILW